MPSGQPGQPDRRAPPHVARRGGRRRRGEPQLRLGDGRASPPSRGCRRAPCPTVRGVIDARGRGARRCAPAGGFRPGLPAARRREHAQLPRRRGGAHRAPACAQAPRPRRRARRVHLDGARLWNAAVAIGHAARGVRRGRGHDHGLPQQGARGARWGRVLVGDAEVIARARDVRKLLRRRHAPGGRARRARTRRGARAARPTRRGPPRARGALAAGPRGRRRASRCRTATVDTNIVVVEVDGPRRPRRAGAPRARRACGRSRSVPDRMRFVTHADVDDADVERAVGGLRRPAPRPTEPWRAASCASSRA